MYTPLDKKLVGDQNKLPEALKAKIEASSESPAKFLGGLSAAAVGSLGGGSGGGSGSGNILDTSGGIAGIARGLAALNKQRNLPNGVMNNMQGQVSTGGPEDIVNPFDGQKFELSPVQMNNESYTPSNEKGSAKPLFPEKTNQIADAIFGQQVPGTFGSALAKKKCNKKY